ncbi:MAG: PKD domain-containing protein [Bacteroidetes bacterium]|nr:PKD domain-containing protein [Bacteroidota bacterium]
MRFYRFIFITILLSLPLAKEAAAQSCTTCGNCDGTVPVYTVDFSKNSDTTVILSVGPRNGLCCGASSPDKCIKFNITVNPKTTQLGFNVKPAPPGGGVYSIDTCFAGCGNPTSIGTKACAGGFTTFCITYCKAGGDADEDTISASSGYSVTQSKGIRIGCGGTLTANGLTNVTWNSVYPGTPGQYNSYLSCTSCNTTTVTPGVGAPAVIKYTACGQFTGCSSGNYCDTARVYVSPALTVSISPSSPVICTGGPNVTLQATPSGGASPYTFTWNTGATTSSISAGVGNYTVTVMDTISSCAAVTQTVNVASQVTPSPPTVTGTPNPVCSGQTLSLSASSTGTTYSWNGPNSFTSTNQNPTIASITTAGNGTYSVTATTSGCTSTAGTGSVTVNQTPAAPTASATPNPVCSGQTLSLSSSTIAGATYSWNGPNSFTSASQNPTISSITTDAAGTYSVTATVSGCTGSAGTVSVTVTQTPSAPSASSNSTVCSGQTLSLSSSTVAGATYSWNGPNSFTSASQNPTIASVTTAANGTYSVTATVSGCTSAAGTTSVTIQQTPAAPAAGSNSTVCSGQTLSLTATSTGTTYSWNGPNGFTSASQNPTISSVTTAAGGTYSVTATTNGCTSSTATTSVTIQQTPAAPVAGNNSTVCSGQTLSLTATSTGTTYSWNGPNSFTSASQNPTIASVTTAAGGTYSVTATTNGCTSSTATTSVTIQQTPVAPTAGSNSTVCSGQTLSLTATSTGTTYSWNGPNSFTSASQNPTIASVTTAAGGTYSVTATTNGCTSSTATTSVTIQQTPAAPAAGSNSTVCSGQTLSLTATSTGTTYSWNGPNSFTSASQNPTIASVTTAAGGTYSVTATTNGCTSSTATTSVTIQQTPAAPTAGSNSTVCSGQALSLTATSTGTSYSWNGPNSFASALQNPTISPVTTAASGTYSVTATTNGCTSSTATTSVTIQQTPAAPTAGSNSTVCSGQTLSLTATSTGTTYSWNGPNSFTSTNQNPTIASVTTAADGTYSVTATTNGCTSSTATTSVTIQQTPVAPAAGSNSTVCSGQTLSLTATSTGTTYSWNGPNSFTSASQNPTIASVTTAAGGTYSVTATTNGCTSSTATTSVTIQQTPAAPTAGSNSTVCSGQTLSLTATSTGTTYSWNGPNSFTSASQNPTISSVTTAAGGTYSVTATTNGCTSATATTSVTIQQTPAAPTAGSNSTVCSGQTLSLTATSTGTTYSWNGPNSFTSASQNPTISSVTTAAGGTYSVTATTNGCTSAAGTTSVTITQTPSALTPGSNSTVCSGKTLSLTSNSVSSAVYSWSGPNSFTSTLQNPTIASVTTAAAGTYTVSASVNGCVGPDAITVVAINQTPVAPTPGSNSTVCSGQTLSLTATSSGTTYSWNGPNSFTSASQNPTISSVTTAANGTYSVTATTNGCTSSTATTSVTIQQTPAAPTAGSNSTVCSGQTLSLTATSTGTTYSWNGPNSFTSASQNPTIASVTTAAGGTYSVTATTNGCTSSTATTSVTINQTPAAPTAGSNGPLCTGTTLSLTASTISGATYSWNGPNSFTSANQNPTISSVTTAEDGTYSVTATVGGCTGAAGTVSVTISPPPAAPSAGSNSTVCTGYTLSLTASTVSGATYNWNGPNSFTSTLQNPTIASVTTAAAGTYSVTATVSGCTGPAGTTVVAINVSPSASTAGSNSPICDGQNLSLTASTVAGVTYQWNGPNGFSSTLQNPTITAATTAASGTYSVTVTAVNGCTSNPTTTTSVTVNPIPAAPTAGSNSPVCLGGDLSLTASTISGATYNWNGPNSFTSAAQNPVISAVTSAAGGTYSVTATVSGCTGPAGTTSVVVNTAPATPSPGSNSPVCTGKTLSLTTSSVPAGSYNWSGPNSFTSSLQNPTIAGVSSAAAGTYSLYISVPGCVSSSTGTVAVTINQTPSPPTPLSSNSPVCSGNNLSLDASTVASVTYNWKGPNSFTSTDEDPVLSGVSTAAGGTYSVSITSAAGCTSSTATISVTVNQTPSAPTASSNSPLCTGVTLSLTASTLAGATYNWNGPNSFTSTLQNPTIASVTTDNAGTYSVTATKSGCTGPAGTVSVTISAPTSPTAGSNSPVCSGKDLSLTASTISGAAYNWTGPNSFTSTDQNPVIVAITTAGSGTYSVTSTVSGCTGPVVPISITVNPTPATPSPSSNSPVCVGFTLSLSSNLISGTTYSWSGPNSFTSSLQNPTIAGVTTDNAGTYSVNVTSSSNGCVSNTATTSVTINVIPSSPSPASSNSPVCSGQTLSLTATTVTGATYSWNGPNSFTSATQNPTIASVTTAAAGTYSVTAKVSGCTSPSATVFVTVNQTPSAPVAGSNSPVCDGNDLSLTASSVGSTYSWNGPNGFTSALQNPVISAVTSAAAGTYSVTATSVAGCTGPAGTTSVSITPLPAAPSAGSNSPVCSGQTVSLTASTISGATYSWSGPNSFTSTAQNPVISSVTTAASGTYSVTATVSGCPGAAGTVAVTINQTPSAPAASSNSPVCSGQTLSLTAATSGSPSYSWNGPNGFTSASQNPTIASVTTAANGTYSVTATENGCTGPAATTSVTINQTPSAPTAGNNSPICSGSTLSLTASTITGATYSWNGPNGFSSTLQNPTIASASTSDAGTYTVNATVSGCTSTDATTSVTINQTPSSPTAGSNSPVCSGKILSLTASTISGATYSWSGPLSYTSTSQNPTISSVTTAMSGTYSVTALVGGCGSSTATVSVTINQTPVISAGANSPVCTGSTISLSATTISGATYNWSGPNSFTSTLQNPTIASATSANAGNYTVTATSSAGCISNNAIKNVIVTQGITANAGANQTVCGNNSTVSLNGNVSGGSTTGIWSTSGSGGFIPGNTTLNGNYIPSNADTATGKVTLTLTSTNNGGCPAAVSSMTVTITHAPTANAGADQTVCANNADVALNGSVNSSATGGNWASSGTGTFTPNSSTLNAVYHPSAADTTAGTVTLVLTTTGVGSCSPATDTMKVTITHAPVANAGADISVCSNNANASLNGSSSTGTGTWSTLGSGTFSPNNTTLNATYVPGAADISAGSVNLILTTTGNGNCNAEKDTVAIIFTAPPTASAGGNQTVCANNSVVALSGTSSTGSGHWSSLGTGIFSPNSNTLNATYTPSASDISAGSVALTLTTLNNGGCIAVSSQMTITITPAPTANAGADQTVCSNNAGVILSGSFTVSSGAQWSTSGDGTFSPDNITMNATYNPGSADTSSGSVTIVLTTTGNGLCNAVSDTMMLTITKAPNVNAGASTVACKNNANVPLNGTSSTGSGTWSTSGSGTFNPNANTLNATYMSSTADTTAGSVTLTLTSANNGNCAAVTSTLVITYIDKPIVFAGNDTTVCSNNDTVYLSGTSNTGSGAWTTNGSGTFTNASLLNTTYVPSAADISAGTINIILTSTKNGTCNPVKDTMKVSFAPSPTANAGADQTVCANNAVVTLNGSFTVSSGAGWTTLGSGTFSPDTSTMNATYTPSAADTTAGSVTIILTTTGNGGCLAVSDSMLITINHAPIVDAGPDQLICFSNLVATLNGNSSTGSGTWTTLGSGTFANSNSLSTTYTPSNADTSAGSVQLILSSANNGLCNPVSDTLLLTFTNTPNVNAGADQTLCANNATVTLTGTSSTGAGLWTTAGTGTFMPNDSSLNASYIPSASDISSGSITITLTSLQGCAPASDSLNVTFTPKPVVNAGIDQTVCAGTMSAVLNGSVTGGATTGQWTTSGSGTFSPNNTTLNATYNLSAADSAAGSITLTLTSTGNGNCLAVSDKMKIFVMQPPLAFAGNDTSICGIQLQLNGIISGGAGTGIWSTLPAGHGAFSPADTILGADYGFAPGDSIISLVLSSTNNGPCPASSDTMTVNITPQPAANAGADIFVCKNNLVAPLNGQVFYTSSGVWQTSGTGTFVPNDTTLNGNYIPSSADTTAGSVTLLLITGGQGICPGDTDSVMVFFTAPPVVNAGANVTICQGDTIAQLNGSVSVGTTTGQWSTLGSGTFVPNDSTLNASYILSSADTAAGGVTLVLSSTNNGTCLAVTDTVQIIITPLPVVNAGIDLTVCANNAAVALTGSITVGSTTGYWTTSGSGTFAPDSSALNAVYTPSAGDTAAGTITLVLTSTKGCNAITDTMLLIITDAPDVFAGNDTAICEGLSLALNGSINSAATGGVWTTSGTGTFVPNDSTLNAVYTPSTADAVAGSVTLVLTSTGNGQCLAVSDTMILSIGRSPVAGFSYSKICTGQSITFTDTSSVISVNDSIVAWNWTIGGGNDTVQNPSYTYSVSGTDSVTLIVTSSIGCTDTAYHIVNINPTPAASFTFSVDCQKDSVFFTNTSTIASGNIISWNWNFGDGDTSALQNPAHNYTATGTYTVTLTVVSDSGCTDIFSDTVAPCSHVTAGFISSSSVCTGQTISFTDISFVMQGDSIVSWNWSFGDGGTDNVQNPSHTYSQSGTDTVSLIVFTNLGLIDTAVHIITINPSPAASFSFVTTCAVDTMFFTNTSTIAGGNIISWNWNFGDTASGANNISSLQNPVHHYDSLGNYIVVLTVTSDSGCTSTFTDTVTPVKGVIAAFSHTGNCNFSYAFTDSSFVANGDTISNCVWDFGDGSPISSASCNPSHTYSASGTYVITHTVTTSGGCSSVAAYTLTVTAPPSADFSPNNGTYNVGAVIDFVDHSSNATSWLWNFGDGNSSTQENPSHQFNQNGTLDVMLIVTNNDGCPDTAKYSFIFNTNIVAVPSAFTPNGDGVNDILKVRGGPLKEMDWRIYNEWGNELFHATDQTQGWDGTYKGKLEPAGRYVYTLTGTTFGDEEINKKGDVTIIR